MRKMQIMRHFILLSLSVLSLVIASVGTSWACPQYVRTYYQDSHGRYYLDYCGHRNYLYHSYYRGNGDGPYCHRDCHGRYYSKDSYGNVYYYMGHHWYR